MIFNVIQVAIIGTIIGILQSVVRVPSFLIYIDLSLIFLCHASLRKGSIIGTTSGFLIGLSLDTLSLAPLGFHALIYSLIGYVFGHLHPFVSSGRILFPALTAIFATILKYLLSFVILILFAIKEESSRLILTGLFFELIFNTLLAPILLRILNFFAKIPLRNRKIF